MISTRVTGHLTEQWRGISIVPQVCIFNFCHERFSRKWIEFERRCPLSISIDQSIYLIEYLMKFAPIQLCFTEMRPEMNFARNNALMTTIGSILFAK